MDVEGGVDFFGAFVHTLEAVVARGDVVGVEAGAVVADGEGELAVGVGEGELDVGGVFGVFDGVVDGFADDEVELVLDEGLGVEVLGVVVEVDGDGGGGLEVLDEVA